MLFLPSQITSGNAVELDAYIRNIYSETPLNSNTVEMSVAQPTRDEKKKPAAPKLTLKNEEKVVIPPSRCEAYIRAPFLATDHKERLTALRSRIAKEFPTTSDRKGEKWAPLRDEKLALEKGSVRLNRQVSSVAAVFLDILAGEIVTAMKNADVAQSPDAVNDPAIVALPFYKFLANCAHFNATGYGIHEHLLSMNDTHVAKAEPAKAEPAKDAKVKKQKTGAMTFNTYIQSILKDHGFGGKGGKGGPAFRNILSNTFIDILHDLSYACGRMLISVRNSKPRAKAVESKKRKLRPLTMTGNNLLECIRSSLCASGASRQWIESCHARIVKIIKSYETKLRARRDEAIRKRASELTPEAVAAKKADIVAKKAQRLEASVKKMRADLAAKEKLLSEVAKVPVRA